ncbi:MAG: choice-of-anchor D domain-containing protein [Bacteroidales bacterium]|nr:choice-of-anchor D domain-containing protein [Bacteroidales bacterium]
MKKITLITLFSFLFLANILNAQTTIQFAGFNWTVRNGSGGPGPNNWSNSPSSVWVDSNGQLHLKIRKIGNIWYCTEVIAQQSFGYGEYRFYVASNVENYDPNIVVGLFTYETDSREIDIEFSRWGDPLKVDGWYTIQPSPYNTNNQKSFSLNLSGDYSTHKFIWNSSNIYFQSYHGHYATLPSSDNLIKQWTYTGNNNPPVGNERLHINFWLFSGNPPTNQQEAELIISAVYVPSVASPSNDNCLGAKLLTLNSSCNYTSGTTIGATSSGFASCSGNINDDDVFYYFNTGTKTTVTINVQGTGSFDPAVQVLSGTCGNSMLQITNGCIDESAHGGFESRTFTGLSTNTTYYIRIGSYDSGSSNQGNFQVCVYSSLADLIITAGTQNVNPTTVTAGSNITVSCSEDNIGTANSGANEVTLWLSADANLNTSNDVYLGQITGFPNVSPNTCSNILSTSIQILPNTTQGNYYLFFWADGNNDVNELIENNNFASKQITVTTQAQPPLTVSYPNGGETLYKGSNYNITWNSSNVTGNIQIDLYKNGSNVLQLAASASNTGTYSFNPPSNLANGSDYKIGISAMSGSVSDFSNSFFTITSQSCTNWSLNPISANFVANGGSGSFIVSATGTGCTYSAISNNSWINSIVYPGYGTTNYNVDANTGTARTGSISIKDGSSGVTVLTFNIAQAGQLPLTVTYPNGGETLYKGSNYNITWNSSNITGNIQIDLYKNGSNVLQLAASASNTGTYSFNPPSNLTNGSDYKIGISAMSGSVSDFSNSSFTITSNANPVINVSGNLSFGSIPISSSSQRMLTINNIGDATLTVSSINYPSGFSGNWSGNIGAGDSLNVTVTFAPTTVTSYSGNITVNSNATSGTNAITCSGTGSVAPTPAISLSGNLNFGGVKVGSSSQQTLTINNIGNASLTVLSINYPSGFSGNWSGNIGAGDSLNVIVTFSPISTIYYSGNITINSTAISGTTTIQCSGLGISSTDINDIDNVRPMIIYPNPTTGLLTIKSNDLADGNYKIFLSTALGQKLLEKEFKITSKSREIQIDIKELPSGMYFLTIQSTKIYQTFSIQKQ